MRPFLSAVLLVSVVAPYAGACQVDRSELSKVQAETPSANLEFGASLSIRGNLLAIGGPGSIGFLPERAVFLYDLALRREIARIESPPDLTLQDARFGRGVLLHGSHVVVRALTRAYVYEITDPLSPTLLGSAIVSDDGPGLPAPLAIDGSTLLVGVPRLSISPSASGVVQLFDISDPSDPTNTLTLEPAVSSANDSQFGEAVAAGDGVLYVGSPLASRVYVYDITDPSAPVEIDRIDPPTGSSEEFGTALALAGSRLAVGAPRADVLTTDDGAIYTFDVSDPANPTLEHTLTTSVPAGGARLGLQVALDGDRVMGVGFGFAELFDTATGQSTGRLVPSDQPPGTFYTAVAVDGQRAFLGASADSAMLPRAGAVYEFTAFGVPCNGADPAEPFGFLNSTDINTFVVAFLAEGPAADLNTDGLFNTADINAFIAAFLDGCP